MTDLNRFSKNLLIVLIIIFNVYFLPKLNNSIIQYFDNVVVRILCIGVILYTCLDDPIIALLLSVCFIMMHTKLQEQNNMDLNLMRENLPGKDFNMDEPMDEPMDESMEEPVATEAEPKFVVTEVVVGVEAEQVGEFLPTGVEEKVSQMGVEIVEVEEEEESVEVLGKDPMDLLLEENHYEPLKKSEDVFGEIESLLTFSDNTFGPASFDSADSLKPIKTDRGVGLDQLDRDNTRIADYNNFKLEH